MGHCTNSKFEPLNIAVLTLSDTRDFSQDTSGQFLEDALIEAGHQLVARQLIKDDKYLIRSVVSQWIASKEVQVIITTGGTGFTERDNTPESVKPLFDREIEGFGELFRHITYTELGTSTVQSRALGGFANKTAIFCLPGSTGACRTGWNNIIKEQLDATHRPCNFVMHVKKVSIDE
ncbi:molybdenum cofactor biosynthesis protein B [Shewanella colwelliana]|uniref:Molybdenum cofactor biosynthesis protein B n=1 Tax=Shewanella colwelliana TaxID=23 RepID=A0A1E5IYI1_SHECO|nr:molybdenum cofactor biosynthesis protein B [Shewanella colwelliana]MCZ4338361.1 molybdenum cofactor biosynthesis protein B [Shewanella colwelliana]MDX1281414.1 molybdenum cofactor biosynthesis protein B [Shewanella colwelliana]OEG75589.1 molybdenum cofactor biosynthesis protein B [Shewanella colwelliana]GIU39340.1 molybdenum cofactor biosynthesis protein B [Shewanella colwelliana]